MPKRRRMPTRTRNPKLSSRLEGKPKNLQSVWFDRRHWTPARARTMLKRHGIRKEAYDLTDGYYAFSIRPSGRFKRIRRVSSRTFPHIWINVGTPMNGRARRNPARKPAKRNPRKKLFKSLGHGFYQISEATAKELVSKRLPKGTGKLPKPGREKLVRHKGMLWWLARTPVRDKMVWSIRSAPGWRVDKQGRAAYSSARERERMGPSVRPNPSKKKTGAKPKRWTIHQIKARHELAGGYFFSPDTMKFFGDTMRSFRVTHEGNQIFVTHRRRGSRWEFRPKTGDFLPIVGETAQKNPTKRAAARRRGKTGRSAFKPPVRRTTRRVKKRARSRRKNPELLILTNPTPQQALEAAEKKYEKFHWKGPTRASRLRLPSAIDPSEPLIQLGKADGLLFRMPAPASTRKRAVTHTGVDFKGPFTKRPYLATTAKGDVLFVFGPSGSKVYWDEYLGHSVAAPRRPAGVSRRYTLRHLGEMVEIFYTTAKDSARTKVAKKWRHPFGKGPSLFTTSARDVLIIFGGGLRVTARGIEG